MQSLSLKNEHFKRINACLYKFIWNRHFSAPKAPERLSRLITNKPMSLGGLGMIDVRELDESLKLRGLARMLQSGHPTMVLLCENMSLNEFFNPVIRTKIDSFSCDAIELLKKDRHKMLLDWDKWKSNRLIVANVKCVKLTRIVNNLGRNSLVMNELRRRNKTRLGDLTIAELTSIDRFVVNKDLLRAARESINVMNLDATNEADEMYPIGNTLVPMAILSSKKFREARADKEPLCIFKCGLIMSPRESITFMARLKSLTSVRHKNTLLRYLHSEVYTGERLARYGLREDSNCIKCGQLDTLYHRLEECPRNIILFNSLEELTRSIRNGITVDAVDTLQKAIGCFDDCNTASLTLNAELLNFLHTDKGDQQDPARIIMRLIERVLKMELNNEVKSLLRTLLV